MKHMIRSISWLLLLCLLLVNCSSCFFFTGKLLPPQMTDPSGGVGNVSPGGATTEAGGDVTPPEVADDLAYTLTQADIEKFNRQLEYCEKQFLKQAGVEEQQLAALDDLEAQYEHLLTQEQIAYLYFCMNEKDTAASENYLFASSACSDAYNGYMAMCRRIDAADTDGRELFFTDWTEEELADMRSYSEESNALQKANSELLVTYRELSDAAFEVGAAEHYVQLLQNNDRLAALSGYDSYWDYAYEKIYFRDYGAGELAAMRGYIKTYLLPMLERTAHQLQMKAQTLDRSQSRLLEQLLYTDYDLTELGLVEAYTESYSPEVSAILGEILDADNAIYTDSANAYEGAFTAYLYELERPICYFGPGYQNSFTVIHEMGHYYSMAFNRSADQPLDLAEVQSQGNEWLFLSFISEKVDREVAEVLLLNQLYNSLSTVICAAIIDEFEQSCYSTLPTASAQLDGIMEDVLDGYGGEEWVNDYIGDMKLYWRYVVIESPVYYISYAVSMLAAMQLYGRAESSYAEAQTVYLKLQAAETAENGFLRALLSVGLRTPMQEALYTELSALLNQTKEVA